MTTSLTTTIAEIEIELFASRGAYLPEHDMLLVADLHLGKDATFRRSGVPVPKGSSEGTLAVVSSLLKRTGAQRLVILGDMFHARSSLAPDVIAAVDQFLIACESVELMLIRGNHDVRVGRLPEHWPIEIVAAGHRLGKLVLAHEPANPPTGADLLLCGHVHPAIRLSGRHGSFGKLPCFWFSGDCLVFPALGKFTGTFAIQARPADRIWLIADDEIIEHVPTNTAP